MPQSPRLLRPKKRSGSTPPPPPPPPSPPKLLTDYNYGWWLQDGNDVPLLAKPK
jgi:hypothetical protein